MPHPIDAQRPNPDELLKRMQEEQEQSRRGRLKIFFGASAGVGKTCAMLSAAHAAQAQGVLVRVGLVETHQRAETQALLSGLAQLPLKEINHRGHSLNEFDLEAALAFAQQQAGAHPPPLLLLDELAHSNAPGSRHPKRWQDVEELLAAGLDVWSTLNVQHLESLNDIVGGITGVQVWETVPDTLFDAADEVVVVDLPPDELLERLAHGKVYLPEQAQRAAANFFRKGNLIALRELTLRRTADRVDSQMQLWRRSNPGDATQPAQWSTRDALLACVGPGSGGESVVRSAARLAAQSNLPWHALFVDQHSRRPGSAHGREQALRALKLAKELGANTATVSGVDLPQTLIDYAREHNLSRLVVGWRTRRRFWQDSLVEQLAALTPDMDILQVPVGDVPRPRGPVSAKNEPSNVHQWPGYLSAVLGCSLVSLLALPLRGVLEQANIVMLFLLVVVAMALRYGRKPAAITAFLAVALFDFFFVPPLLSFSVSDVQYLITFAVMLAVALLIGQLTASLRAQAKTASAREKRVRGLYQMSRELSSALLLEQVTQIAARFLANERFSQYALLVADEHNRLNLQPGATATVDQAVAQWCFEQGQMAGRGTHTLPASQCLMLPLKGPMRLRGVLAVSWDGHSSLSPEQLQLLETCASLLAISIERIHYIEVAQSSTVQIETERLRNALLAAISHDLRTPLTALVGLAETLQAAPPESTESYNGIALAIAESARRMNAQVSNLLDMAKLQSGTVNLQRQWLPLEELIGSALALCHSALGQRRVQIELADDLPLLFLDAALFERLLLNLLENACKYSPADSPLRIYAQTQESCLRLYIEDNGPGLPIGREAAVFEKFERGHKEPATSGVGLGLAICRAIAQVHGGRIWGENRFAQGAVCGARIIIELPLGEPPSEDGSQVLEETETRPADE